MSAMGGMGEMGGMAKGTLEKVMGGWYERLD